MKYTVCTSYPRGDELGSGARPNINDMIDVVRLRFGLEVNQGPYASGDGTAKICFITESPSEMLQLITLFQDKGIDSYWYDDNPSRKQGDVCRFGNRFRWDKQDGK
ncbi:MAG: hypothetical protein U9P50_03375 [Patescibacteria group bacterium]|nr:hypothetical protein [Patescibacteria group bacterium]